MTIIDALAAFEEHLQDHAPALPGFHPHFEKASWEMVRAGGKRFRPALCLSVVQAYEPLLLPSALDVALAIELLHTYSLIHDDLPVMDNASMRRGHPTLHETYDEVTATLVGDGLNTHAFYLLAKARLDAGVKIRLVEELATSGGLPGMVLGQAVDCHFENHPLTLEQLRFLHLHKTGKLIAASLKMGAICCALDGELERELEQIGLDVGLLFQINDDLIDATQSAEEAGKDTGVDGDKNSYVNLLGLQGAVTEKERLQQSLTQRINLLHPVLRDNLQILFRSVF